MDFGLNEDQAMIVETTRAFVETELADGRLVQVMDRVLQVAPQYYIFRKRSADRRPEVDAVWNWCLQRITAPID